MGDWLARVNHLSSGLTTTSIAAPIDSGKSDDPKFDANSGLETELDSVSDVVDRVLACHRAWTGDEAPTMDVREHVSLEEIDELSSLINRVERAVPWLVQCRERGFRCFTPGGSTIDAQSEVTTIQPPVRGRREPAKYSTLKEITVIGRDGATQLYPLTQAAPEGTNAEPSLTPSRCVGDFILTSVGNEEVSICLNDPDLQKFDAPPREYSISKTDAVIENGVYLSDSASPSDVSNVTRAVRDDLENIRTTALKLARMIRAYQETEDTESDKADE